MTIRVHLPLQFSPSSGGIRKICQGAKNLGRPWARWAESQNQTFDAETNIRMADSTVSKQTVR